MPDVNHDEIVQESFRHQVPAFSGEESVYVGKDDELRWAGPLGPAMIVLDAACGAAHSAQPLAAHVHQVVGIDLTTDLLEVGAKRLHDAGVRNVLLQQCNVECLPFVDDSFDLTYCRSSLHHFEHPRTAITEMARVTTPGGRLVLIDLVACPRADRDRFDALHRMLDPSHVRTYLDDELVDALPADSELAYRDTAEMRFPIDVAIAENSDRDGVIAAIREELDGGPQTGFSPAEDNGVIFVSFLICTVHTTIR